MLWFTTDYSEGAHPKVLEHMLERNMVSLAGYGEDPDTEGAKKKICRECGREDLQICFLAGGTQTNRVAISSMLQAYEGVVCADTGHIAVHESGAIESSGHKVITVPNADGKLQAEALEKLMVEYLSDDTCEHMVRPGMVYISHPTELGTLYKKEELIKLHTVCNKFGLPLYLDGARLGYGLMSPESDMTICDIAELTDLFYIGGTKVGAICGEALVYTKHNMPKHFLSVIKQQGALLAKTRVVSHQFDALFTDGLYWEIGRHAVKLAMRMKELFRSKGYELFTDSPTNQQFFILSEEQFKRLREKVVFSIWQKLPDGRCACRFVTSWATTQEDIEELGKLL